MGRIAVLILAQAVSMLLQGLIFVGCAQSIVRIVRMETAVTVLLVDLPAMAYNYFYTQIRDATLAVRMVSMGARLTINVLVVIRLVMDAHCRVLTVSNARAVNSDSLAPTNADPAQMATTETPQPNYAPSVPPVAQPAPPHPHAQAALQ